MYNYFVEQIIDPRVVFLSNQGSFNPQAPCRRIGRAA
jgi:hypothetical protein